MKLIELLKSYSWEEIKPKIIELYPDEEANIEKFKKVYNELQFRDIIDSDQSIYIRILDDDDDDEDEGEYVDVSCVLPNEETIYSLSFIPWNKCIGMDIILEEDLNLSDVEVLVHCLWEITWHGFSEESVQRIFNDLNCRIQEFDEGEVKGEIAFKI